MGASLISRWRLSTCKGIEMSGPRQRMGEKTDTKYHGLFNEGATCYLNSVLQVLFMTKDFREAVERYSCDTKCVDHHLTNLFRQLGRGSAHAYRVREMLGIYRGYEQYDAAECFERILSSLTNTEASQIFQGELTHKDTCHSCRKESVTVGPFWSLHLELVESHKKTFTVVDGIDNFFRESDVSGSNQLYCDQCAAKSDTSHRCEIKQHPAVLMLLLKRFRFDNRRKEHVKIKCSVEFPYNLQMPEYQIYELYAYVEHFGDLRGGHYTATIKSQEDERWYNFNDTIVRPLHQWSFQLDNKKMKESQSAYLLFYRKMKRHDADTLTLDTSAASTPVGRGQEISDNMRCTCTTPKSSVKFIHSNVKIWDDKNLNDVGQSKCEHLLGKQEHSSSKHGRLGKQRDEEKIVKNVKIEEDSRTGADGRKKAAGSEKPFASYYHRSQGSGEAHGPELYGLGKLKVKKDERHHQDNKRNADIQQTKPEKKISVKGAGMTVDVDTVSQNFKKLEVKDKQKTQSKSLRRK